jgi:hypothetical protein
VCGNFSEENSIHIYIYIYMNEREREKEREISTQVTDLASSIEN